MKRIIAFILALATVLMILGSVGCASTAENTASAAGKEQNRFEKVYDKWGYAIVVDTETNVMYLRTLESSIYGKGVGLTVMVDAQGKPLLWEGE